MDRTVSASILRMQLWSRMRMQFLMSLQSQMRIMLPGKDKFLYHNVHTLSNNNTTKFQLHLQFFAHATLLKAGSGFQYISNIITVVDNAYPDARWLTFVDADVDTTLRTQIRIQNSRIRTSMLCESERCEGHNQWLLSLYLVGAACTQ